MEGVICSEVTERISILAGGGIWTSWKSRWCVVVGMAFRGCRPHARPNILSDPLRVFELGKVHLRRTRPLAGSALALDLKIGDSEDA